MKRERRQPTRAGWRQITSRRPRVRRIPPPEVPYNTSRSPGPNLEERPADRGEAENEERKGAT